MSRIEQTIIHHLITDEQYARKVLPFITKEYFSDTNENVLIQEIVKFFGKYNSLPSKEVLLICTAKRDDLTEVENKEVQKYIKELDSERVNEDWLLDETEKFCKDRAVYNAILDSINIIDGKDKKRSKDSIPSILSEALAISFDTNIGHDYLENAEERWEYYHVDGGHRIAFGLEMLNKITKGGMKKKTLNCVMAGTGIGKTILMCDEAGYALSQGHNVLYITLEMAAEDISHRIDAKLMNITMDDVEAIDKKMFMDKIGKIKSKTNGKLIVKEYPTGVHAGHFRALIEELKQKKDFIPDLIIIDYLGICGSQRLRGNSSVNTNTYYRSVSEELRDLGKEYDVPIFTGVQPNRDGQDNSDTSITNIAEAIGITSTLDFFIVLMAPEELIEIGQVLVKQLKNRYRDINYYKKFVIGLDKSRMTFYDVDNEGKYLDDSGTKEEPKSLLLDIKNNGSKVKVDSFTF
jgi:replicative DNA helicase